MELKQTTSFYKNTYNSFFFSEYIYWISIWLFLFRECVCVCTERKNNNINWYHVESNQWPYIRPQGKGTPATLISSPLTSSWNSCLLNCLFCWLSCISTNRLLTFPSCLSRFSQFLLNCTNVTTVIQVGKLRVVLGSFHGLTPCLYSTANSWLSSLVLLHLLEPRFSLFLTWSLFNDLQISLSPPGSPIHILSSFHTSTVLISQKVQL